MVSTKYIESCSVDVWKTFKNFGVSILWYLLAPQSSLIVLSTVQKQLKSQNNSSFQKYLLIPCFCLQSKNFNWMIKISVGPRFIWNHYLPQTCVNFVRDSIYWIEFARWPAISWFRTRNLHIATHAHTVASWTAEICSKFVIAIYAYTPYCYLRNDWKYNGIYDYILYPDSYLYSRYTRNYSIPCTRGCFSELLVFNCHINLPPTNPTI